MMDENALLCRIAELENNSVRLQRIIRSCPHYHHLEFLDANDELAPNERQPPPDLRTVQFEPEGSTKTHSAPAR